jgi:hypothetical protein
LRIHVFPGIKLIQKYAGLISGTCTTSTDYCTLTAHKISDNKWTDVIEQQLATMVKYHEFDHVTTRVSSFLSKQSFKFPLSFVAAYRHNILFLQNTGNDSVTAENLRNLSGKIGEVTGI